ncbi:MAG TPA: hypothetical protein VED59_05575, partial [Acidimicrobiales bacterium]|nr:hypothetical protein [Acidimicrobiales bacterium]
SNAVTHLDNLTNVGQEMSDALSTAVTGPELDARRLYSDNEQVTIRFKRTILVTAINHPFRANDLTSRALWFPLPPIDPLGTAYLEGQARMLAFQEERPILVGSCLHVLSRALGRPEPKMSFVTRFPEWCSLGARVAEELGRSAGEFGRRV